MNDQECITQDNSCGGYKHCTNKLCDYMNDPECVECVNDAYSAIEMERYRGLDLTDKVTDVLMEVAKAAYVEGRDHQQYQDFPDVGMQFTKTFKDTKIYKMILRKAKR